MFFDTRSIFKLGQIFISCYNAGAVVRSLAFFGRGDGPAWLDDVHCSGTESRLVNCLSNRVGYHNCDHSEDAGVTCQSKIIKAMVK